MININIYGVIISILMILPLFIVLLFKPKIRIRHIEHKQIKIIEFISYSGNLFFGFITLDNMGYHKINEVTFILWVIIFLLLYFFMLFLYLRYIIKGKKEEYLYNKFIIKAPIALIYALLFLISGILLFNPFILFFAPFYLFSHYYIEYKKNYE